MHYKSCFTSHVEHIRPAVCTFWSLVSSHFDCGSAIYGSATKTALKMLDPVLHQGSALHLEPLGQAPSKACASNVTDGALNQRTCTTKYALKGKSMSNRRCILIVRVVSYLCAVFVAIRWAGRRTQWNLQNCFRWSSGASGHRLQCPVTCRVEKLTKETPRLYNTHAHIAFTHMLSLSHRTSIFAAGGILIAAHENSIRYTPSHGTTVVQTK